MPNARKWTRPEVLLALNLYRKLKFGQLHGRNPVIIELAARLERSANSVAMKLCNLASLDPFLKARNIRGLAGASHLDREVWAEYQENPLEIVVESEDLLRKAVGAGEGEDLDVQPARGIRVGPPAGPTEHLATVKVRRSQQFFRQMILNAFDSRCCVTGLPVRELLVASHILPWSQFPQERLNPQNGLCLSRLHDAAFDARLITFDSDLRLVMSRRLKDFLPQSAIEQNFAVYEGRAMTVPEDSIPPSREFLRQHREKMFDA